MSVPHASSRLLWEMIHSLREPKAYDLGGLFKTNLGERAEEKWSRLETSNTVREDE